MVILQVQVEDFALLNVEGDPPIAADGNAPGSGAVALELVNAPSGGTGNRIHVRRRNEHRQNVAEPLHEIGTKLAGIVVLNETQKSSVLNAVDNHGKSLPFKFKKPLQIGFDCDLPKTEAVAIHPLALAGRKATASCATLRNAGCLFCGIERL